MPPAPPRNGHPSLAEVAALARAALAAGISVVPPVETGEKRPRADFDGPEGKTWEPLRREHAGDDMLAHWYERLHCTGVGFVCGAISRGLELFEFDDRETYDRFREAAAGCGLGDLVGRLEGGYLEETPGGGVHWFYRCAEVRGNTKLARRPGKPAQVLIETRGEGGFAVVAPSFGKVHPSGRPYRLLSGGVDSIASVTPAERDALWELARSFDEMPKMAFEPSRAKDTSDGEGEGIRPGDDYNARTKWADILEPEGWKAVYSRGDTTYWRRPGKAIGVSATTNRGDSDCLFVFSSSTDFEAERPYTKFGAYALLKHRGDFGSATRALARDGYGAPPRAKKKAGGGKAAGNGQVVPRAQGGQHRTDLGNARRLIALHGQDVRYCHPWRKWLIWTGARWEADDRAHVYRLARSVVTALHAEAGAIEDKADRDEAFAWAFRSEGSARLNAMVELAAHEPGVPILPGELDASPWLLNCPNGTLDLISGELRPHRREDLITKLAGSAYLEDADCPTWFSFLTRILADDSDLLGYFQRIVGYSLSGSVADHALFFLHGRGQNGKSTFVEAVQHVMGDYAITINADVLTTTAREQHPTGVADLQGRRFVATVEVEDGRRLAEALVKQLTGGDRIRARRMGQDFFEFEPTHKLWMAANHKPTIRGGDVGIWRRIKMIPFAVQIPKEEINADLPGQLHDEGPGILAWAVRGFREWRTVGLRDPPVVIAATDAYKEEMDPILDFLGECCVAGPEAGSSEKASDLFMAYAGWCRHIGEPCPVSRNRFGRILTEKGIGALKNNSVAYRTGIKLNVFGQKFTKIDHFK
jgi:putative DNA primase/helicase